MIEEKRICRYCHIGDDNIGNNNIGETHTFCSPCLCSGSCKYVHKECLIEWFRQKVTRPVLPGYFFTCNFKCEICGFPYIIEEVQLDKKEKIILYFYIFFAIFILTCIHCFSYFIFGMICSIHPSLNNMFGKTQNDLYTIFYNGFILTHILLAFIYFIVLFSQTNLNENHVFIRCFRLLFNYTDDNSIGIEFTLELSIFLITSIFIFIYYETITGIILKSKQSRKIIIDIIDRV